MQYLPFGVLIFFLFDPIFVFSHKTVTKQIIFYLNNASHKQVQQKHFSHYPSTGLTTFLIKSKVG